jgi:hypothetical protein
MIELTFKVVADGGLNITYIENKATANDVERVIIANMKLHMANYFTKLAENMNTITIGDACDTKRSK